MKDFDVKAAIARTVEVVRANPSTDSGSLSDRRICTFYIAPKAATRRDALREPGPTQFLSHLERLPSVRVLNIRSAMAFDQYEANFSYKGHLFSISVHWGGDMAVECSKKVPERVFEAVCTHLRNYQKVGFGRLLLSAAKYSFLRQRSEQSGGDTDAS